MVDLTPKVVEATDTTTYERGSGKTRKITRVVYMLGELGSFTAEFDQGTFTDAALDEVMRERARALQRHT